MICSNVDHIYALGVRGKLDVGKHREGEGESGLESGREDSQHEDSERTQSKDGAEERRLLERARRMGDPLLGSSPPEFVQLYRFAIPERLRQRLEGAEYAESER